MSVSKVLSIRNVTLSALALALAIGSPAEAQYLGRRYSSGSAQSQPAGKTIDGKTYPFGAGYSQDGTIYAPNSQTVLGYFYPSQENLQKVGFTAAAAQRFARPALPATPQADTSSGELDKLRAQIEELKKDLAACNAEQSAPASDSTTAADAGSEAADATTVEDASTGTDTYGIPPEGEEAPDEDSVSSPSDRLAQKPATDAGTSAETQPAEPAADPAATEEAAAAEAAAAIETQQARVDQAYVAMTSYQSQLDALKAEHLAASTAKHKAYLAHKQQQDKWNAANSRHRELYGRYLKTLQTKMDQANATFERIDSRYQPLRQGEIRTRTLYDAEKAKLNALKK